MTEHGWQGQAATQFGLVIQRLNQDINCTQVLTGVLGSLETRPVCVVTAFRASWGSVCVHGPHHSADTEQHILSNNLLFLWGGLMTCDLVQFTGMEWNEFTCPRSQQQRKAAGLFQWVSLAGMTAQSTQPALYLWRFLFVYHFTASSSDE